MKPAASFIDCILKISRNFGLLHSQFYYQFNITLYFKNLNKQDVNELNPCNRNHKLVVKLKVAESKLFLPS